MNTRSLIRVLVADDHNIVRQGLVALINRKRGMKVVAQASTGCDAVQQFNRHRPDVCLIDLRMPDMDGVEAIRSIRELNPDANIIVLTTFDDEEDIQTALRFGAKAYLLKDITRDELIDSITAVYDGRACKVPSSVALKLAAHLRSSELTARETQVIRLVTAGKSNKEIASLLELSEGTVKLHINHILRKLKAESRTEAVSIALKKGIVRIG